jgi:uncharacterized protein
MMASQRVPCHAEPMLPASAGLKLKPQHDQDILDMTPSLGFFEVHAETYMGAGGPPHRFLERIRDRYPLSLHGVGLSIGGDGPLDRAHLTRLKGLIERYRPGAFSEPLAWSRHDTIYLNDQLPVPYTRETLSHICDHVDAVQEILGVRMLLENPASYITFEQTDMAETDFLREVVRRTGCKLLLDVTNVFVSAVNQGFDPIDYIAAFPAEHVGEIHLAGFAEDHDENGARLLIACHGAPVAPAVWRLFERVIARTGPMPTLIEWDQDVPPLSLLLDEARRADRFIALERLPRQPVADPV